MHSPFSAFKAIDGSHATLQRAVYTLGNIMSLGLAIYKCQVMGLLPTHPSDWLAFVQPQEVRIICNKISIPLSAPQVILLTTLVLDKLHGCFDSDLIWTFYKIQRFMFNTSYHLLWV